MHPVFFGLFNIFRRNPTNSIYQLEVKNINGEAIHLSKYKGKKLLILNTASNCGFTKQYKNLQALHSEYASKGLVILAFPCNDFGKQEPGNNNEIENFCESNYHLQFNLMEKISIKGKNRHPLFYWLTHRSENGVLSSKILWNFQKYLIDEKGQLVNVLAPWVNPQSKIVRNWLENQKV